MKILIIGGSGYIGFPLACKLAGLENDVLILDNNRKQIYSKELKCSPLFGQDGMETRIGKVFELTGMDTSLEYDFIDANDARSLYSAITDFEPQVVINCTMTSALPGIGTNTSLSALTILHNILQCINTDCHAVNLSIPMITSDHTLNNVLATAAKSLLQLYCRRDGLVATNISLGSVYGIMGEYWHDAGIQTTLHYDDVFGTVINRLVCQVMGRSFMSIYHSENDNNKYKYLDTYLDRTTTICQLEDALAGIDKALEVCPRKGELRHISLFSEAISLRTISDMITDAATIEGHTAAIQYFYQDVLLHRQISTNHDEDGFAGFRTPSLLSIGYIREMMQVIAEQRHLINKSVCGAPRFSY